MTQIFNDGKYTVFLENIKQLKEGDKIHITTSEFPYDCRRGCFMNQLNHCAKIEAKVLHEDLSEYVPEKSTNGGCYAYALLEVIKIL